MPINDQRQWHDPFTAHGLKPPPGTGAESFQIHEVGSLQHGAEWNHRQVRSPFWRFYHDATLGAWIESGGRRHDLGPGRFVLVPDGVAFNCGSGPGVNHLWIHFSLYLSLTTTSVSVCEVRASATALMVAAELRRAIGARQSARAAAVAAALLHLVFADVWPDGPETTPARLRKILGWIQHGMGGEVSNEMLAAQAGLSVEGFIRWFKASTGRTPAAFVAERRVQEACRRLAYTEESIEQIAADVGFANRHHFSRVFKRYAGCGPAKFRRRTKR